MSDEESFVILGSCSIHSNDSIRSDFASLEQSKLVMDNIENATSNLNLNNECPFDDVFEEIRREIKEKVKKLEDEKREQILTGSVENVEGVDKNGENIKNCWDEYAKKVMESRSELQNTVHGVKSSEIFEKCTQRVMEKSSDSQETGATRDRSVSPSRASGKSDGSGSLAASFILGEVKADVLKTSVYSQFPSLCSMEFCPEDIKKLQVFMAEYVELKGTLATVNNTMRQFYNKTQEWRGEMQKTERQYEEYLEGFRNEISTLRKENRFLKDAIVSKIAKMRATEESQQNQIEFLTLGVSEKTSIINKMRHQIMCLENQMEAFERTAINNPDYVRESDTLLSLKGLGRQMSAVVAQNCELQDMKKIYADETNCLKVKLKSAEELLHQAKNDIIILKSKDIEKTHLFEKYEEEREMVREEIALLRQQVEIYRKDFEMERTARESLAGEKDQIMQDLRALQQLNQQLIEEQQRRLESVKTTQPSNSNAVSNSNVNAAQEPQRSHKSMVRTEPIKFSCPVCSQIFNSLNVLQGHVNRCLDKA